VGEDAGVELAVDPLGELLPAGLGIEHEREPRPALGHRGADAEDLLRVERRAVLWWGEDGRRVDPDRVVRRLAVDRHERGRVPLPPEVAPTITPSAPLGTSRPGRAQRAHSLSEIAESSPTIQSPQAKRPQAQEVIDGESWRRRSASSVCQLAGLARLTTDMSSRSSEGSSAHSWRTNAPSAERQ
jgi:hypothetical protein